MEEQIKEMKEYPTKPEGKYSITLDYTLCKPIGKGTFGIVWKARVHNGPHKDSYVFIKIINLDDFGGKSLEEIRVVL